MLMGWDLGKDRSQPLWVARKDEAEVLQRSGFRNARAIGLPIVYADNRAERPTPGGLLVMPAHSLDYTTHAWELEEYADAVAAVRSNFSEVVVCVHPSCFEKGYWVEQFRRRDFPIVLGAAVEDTNALDRLCRIISQFEFVTTNAVGSHIAYASYLGARVSIYGPYAQYRAEDYRNTRYYRENPQLLDPALEALSEKAVRNNCPDLFCHPRDAAVRVEWGRHQVGFENRVSPAELR
jgi:hypothetical protein